MSVPSPVFRYNPLTGKLDLSDDHGSSSNPYPGGVAAWVGVAGTSQDMDEDTGYISLNDLDPVQFTLPAICGFGKYFRIGGVGAGGWVVNANPGQIIHIGNQATSNGGALSSTKKNDAIEILCVVQDAEFLVIGAPQGNLDVS